MKKLTDEVSHRIQEESIKKRISEPQAMVELAKETPLLDLKHHCVQAFAGQKLVVRDRCWRCRITFNYDWIYEEEDPINTDLKEVKDFEKSQVQGDQEVQGVGKCAEYLIWWRCRE